MLLSYGADVEDEARMKQPLKWSAFAVVAGVYALVLVVLLVWTRELATVAVLTTCALFASLGTLTAARTVPRVTPKVPAILFVLGFVTQLAGGPTGPQRPSEGRPSPRSSSTSRKDGTEPRKATGYRRHPWRRRGNL